MCLCVVLEEQQVMLLAETLYRLGHGTSAVQMDCHYRLGAGCKNLMEQTVVYLQSLPSRFYENGLQPAFGDGKNGGDISVGRYNDLVALMQSAQFHFASEHQLQSIQSVSARYAVLCADVLGVSLSKLLVGFALQIPSALHHLMDGIEDILL